jgi:F-type H+-transporting ATPase subunit b
VDFNLTLIGQTIAMIVFVWFAMKYIWPPLMQALEERRKQVADGIAAGEKGVRDLEAARAQAQAIVEEARSKAVKIVDEANARHNEILGEAKHDAEKERARQLEQAQAEIAQAANRARDELRNQVSALAIAGAEKILKREIDPKAHGDLLAEMVAQV